MTQFSYSPLIMIKLIFNYLRLSKNNTLGKKKKKNNDRKKKTLMPKLYLKYFVILSSQGIITTNKNLFSIRNF